MADQANQSHSQLSRYVAQRAPAWKEQLLGAALFVLRTNIIAMAMKSVRDRLHDASRPDLTSSQPAGQPGVDDLERIARQAKERDGLFRIPGPLPIQLRFLSDPVRFGLATVHKIGGAINNCLSRRWPKPSPRTRVTPA